MRKYAFLTILILFVTSGCGSKKPKYAEEELAVIPLAQREDLPRASGGFTLAVGGETITSDDIITNQLLEYFGPMTQKSYRQFVKQARPELKQLITTKISNILLYQQAKRDAGSGVDLEQALKKATETETRRFIARFNGDSAKAEQALKQMGMDWDDFKEYQRKMILSQDYIRRQMPEARSITYGELLACYDDIKDEYFATPPMITFRLIDIPVPGLKPNDPNVGPLKQTTELANEIMERLRKGEDFGELAKQYSQGHRASLGGLWKPVQPESLARPYDVVAAKAEKMRPSQIAGPIKSGEHLFIIKLEEIRAKSFEPLAKVQKIVEAKILFDRRKAAVDELSAKLVQQAALGERDAFADFCLEKIYRICNQ